MPEIILVHGLWYRSWSTWLLRWRLRRAGFRVRPFGYSSTFMSPWVTQDRLFAQLEASPAPVCHLVGYSLGGLIVSEMLVRHGPPPRGRVVLLGSPVNGSAAARSLARTALGRLLLGRAGALLQRGVDLGQAGWPVGMIAGTGNLGLGRLSGGRIGPGDGTVGLSETDQAALDDRVELAATHVGMLLSREVAARVIRYLEKGRFDDS